MHSRLKRLIMRVGRPSRRDVPRGQKRRPAGSRRNLPATAYRPTECVRGQVPLAAAARTYPTAGLGKTKSDDASASVSMARIWSATWYGAESKVRPPLFALQGVAQLCKKTRTLKYIQAETVGIMTHRTYKRRALSGNACMEDWRMHERITPHTPAP